MPEVKYTRKALLQVPKRKWNEQIKASGVYVIPSRRKHDSGFACMDFVAETKDGLIRFGGYCDDVSFEGQHFRMDCIYPEIIIHIWNGNANGFTVTSDVSSISFVEGR